MERLSTIAPCGHFSHFEVSAEDRARLARISTCPSSMYSKERVAFATQPAHIGKSINSPTFSLDIEEPEKPVVFKPGTRFYLAFSALAALSLVVALDGTSLSVALPVIAKVLHGSATTAFWAGTSFLLGSTVFLPIYAAFSSIFGRKYITLIAITLFFVGTLVSGTASDMTMMLIGRSIQGIGGGGITAMTNILMTDLVPLRYRGNWIGILGAMWAIGSVSGPIIGGALSHKSTWSWIFYLNLPFIVTSFALVVFFIRLKSIQSSFLHKLGQADWFGSFLFVASITSILIPLTWGGVMYQWSSWHVIAPIGFGIVGLVILAYHERFVATVPIIRREVFANRTANIAYITTAMHGMALWCLLYYQPLYFEGVRGFSPVIAGVALLPATFSVAPMAIISGFLISKFGKYRWAIWSGWIATTMGIGFLCAIDTGTQLWQVILTDLLAGVGLGSLFPALQFQLQSASPPDHLTSAVAMFCFSRGLGQTLGVAIGGNIFQNSLAASLKKHPQFASQAAELAKDATAIVEWLKVAPDGDSKRIMTKAYIDSMRLVYIVIVCFAFVATCLSLFVKHYDLNRPLESKQYLVEGQENETSSEIRK